jgi:hypothetical protein
LGESFGTFWYVYPETNPESTGVQHVTGEAVLLGEGVASTNPNSRMPLPDDGRPRSGRLAVEALNSIFTKSLYGYVEQPDPSSLVSKPFDVTIMEPVDHPAHLRVYLYNMTTHINERQTGAYKVQAIIGKGHRRQERAHFDTADNAFVLLAGYEPELEVFCLWDAPLYDLRGLTYSQNIQVKDETLLAALTEGLAMQRKSLRGITPGSSNFEDVVAVHRTRLSEGLQRRWDLTVARLVGE